MHLVGGRGPVRGLKSGEEGRGSGVIVMDLLNVKTPGKGRPGVYFPIRHSG